MSRGFPLGTYAWQAVEGSRIRSAAKGDIASMLDVSLLSRFTLEPSGVIVFPTISIDGGAGVPGLEITSSGRVIVTQPCLFKRFDLVRRREGQVGSGVQGEVFFLGLHRDGLPTTWVHVLYGRIHVTHRSP